MKLRFVPDTLFGRLISALLAVVVITMLIFVALIVRERRAFLFTGGEAGAIANAVAETSVTLAALSGEARAAEITRLAADSITISRSGDFRQPLNRDDYVAALSSLRTRLERALPPGYGFGLRPARPGPRTGDEIRVRDAAAPRRRVSAGAKAEGPREAFGGIDGPDPGGGPGFHPNDGPGGPPSSGPGAPGGGFNGDLAAARVPAVAGGSSAAARRFPGRGRGRGHAAGRRRRSLFRTDVPRAGPPLSIQIFVELGAAHARPRRRALSHGAHDHSASHRSRARGRRGRPRRAPSAVARDRRARAPRGDARVQRDARAAAPLSR